MSTIDTLTDAKLESLLNEIRFSFKPEKLELMQKDLREIVSYGENIYATTLTLAQTMDKHPDPKEWNSKVMHNLLILLSRVSMEIGVRAARVEEEIIKTVDGTLDQN
tara:strand:- start:244 stop:564 length:321 start_codon:yes stop_codon:yes gene_type:complete